MVESLDKSSLDFDKQICFCTGLREMFEVNYLRAKYNKRSAAPLMPSIFFLHSPLRFSTVVSKVVSTKLFFQMQLVKNVLVYIFGVFTFIFCYCFHEDLIHKIILVSQFLPFICISYPLKVFKSDTGILRKLVFTSHSICFYYKIKTNLGNCISFECNLATMYIQIMF